MTQKPSHSATSRRQFGRIAVASAAATFGAPAFLRGRNLNDKLNIALIATGGRGRANLKGVESENIVALCEVYEPSLNMVAEKYPNAIRCGDYRQLYDKHSNAFDAVVVSTPESHHAFGTLPALQLGKHVYCEKPLTRDVYEARVIREAAAKTKLATQMGTQNHSNPIYRQVVEIIQSGAIGPVREVHTWVSRAWGWQSPEDAEKNKDIVSVQERPEGSTPLPAGLDWENWVGPAPMRPFHEVYWPGPKWYRWWDFGNGTMSDLGSHSIDLPFWALKLDAPRTIEAFGPPPHPEIAPASMHVVYEYDARGDLPPVTLTWYQGVDKPELWTSGKVPQWQNGSLFVGESGMLMADYRNWALLPEDKFRDYKPPEPFLPQSPGHYLEWIEAAKTGAPTGSNFEYAGWLTEANHLGNVAFRVGKKLTWDAPGMYCPNAPEAEAYLRRDYRAGWKLV